jgi:histidine ammonia-lyase
MDEGGHGGPLLLDGNSLRPEEVGEVARGFRRAALAPGARGAMRRSRALVDRWVAERKPIYGVNTGFGSLQDVAIAPEEVEDLQENILVSHAAGVGDVLPEEVVRAMMLLRANALAKGYSGVRVEVVELLLGMLNRRVCPVVLDKGSVGSSGDLAPLAHMALPMIGRGEAFHRGKRLPGAEALRRARLRPVVLKAKEGLALTNGTQFMTAVGVLATLDAQALTKLADVAGAMSLEAMKGRSEAFAEAPHRLRPFEGQIDCARNVRALVAGSNLIDADDADTEKKRQDAYSLRCMPQVHGASRQAVGFVRGMIEIEINAATDNPLILPGGVFPGEDEDDSVSAGNFHGQPVALSMDFLALAVAELGSISERRVARLMNRNESYGLPPYLTERAGLNSGLMIAQYAAAALVSENKVLIHPASGDSIPTSANQEDHNSMGNIAARQAREVLENVRRVLAVELLCAAQALGIRMNEKRRRGVKAARPGVGVRAAYELIRRHVPQRERDTPPRRGKRGEPGGELYRDIQTVLDLVLGGDILRAVDAALAGRKRQDGPLV